MGMKILRGGKIVNAFITCDKCVHFKKDCPLHGCTDFYDEPFEGNMIKCIYYGNETQQPDK